MHKKYFRIGIVGTGFYSGSSVLIIAFPFCWFQTDTSKSIDKNHQPRWSLHNSVKWTTQNKQIEKCWQNHGIKEPCQKESVRILYRRPNKYLMKWLQSLLILTYNGKRLDSAVSRTSTEEIRWIWFCSCKIEGLQCGFVCCWYGITSVFHCWKRLLPMDNFWTLNSSCIQLFQHSTTTKKLKHCTMRCMLKLSFCWMSIS